MFSLEQWVASKQPFKQKSKAAIDKTGDTEFRVFFNSGFQQRSKRKALKEIGSQKKGALFVLISKGFAFA